MGFLNGKKWALRGPYKKKPPHGQRKTRLVRRHVVTPSRKT